MFFVIGKSCLESESEQTFLCLVFAFLEVLHDDNQKMK
jgi:hypothetical protein